jgi:hypothetical protein
MLDVDAVAVAVALALLPMSSTWWQDSLNKVGRFGLKPSATINKVIIINKNRHFMARSLGLINA